MDNRAETGNLVVAAIDNAGMSLRRLSEITRISKNRLWRLKCGTYPPTRDELSKIFSATNAKPQIGRMLLTTIGVTATTIDDQTAAYAAHLLLEELPRILTAMLSPDNPTRQGGSAILNSIGALVPPEISSRQTPWNPGHSV